MIHICVHSVGLLWALCTQACCPGLTNSNMLARPGHVSEHKWAWCPPPLHHSLFSLAFPSPSPSFPVPLLFFIATPESAAYLAMALELAPDNKFVSWQQLASRTSGPLLASSSCTHIGSHNLNTWPRVQREEGSRTGGGYQKTQIPNIKMLQCSTNASEMSSSH